MKDDFLDGAFVNIAQSPIDILRVHLVSGKGSLVKRHCSLEVLSQNIQPLLRILALPRFAGRVKESGSGSSSKDGGGGDWDTAILSHGGKLLKKHKVVSEYNHLPT